MRQMKERNGKLLEVLQELIYREPVRIDRYKIKQTAERITDPMQVDSSDWQDFDSRGVWGGDHEYFLFDTQIVIPEQFRGCKVVYELKTGREGQWDATNPQFLAYVDGKIRQGLDVNHREILLTDCAEGKETYRLLLAAYTGDRFLDLKMDSEVKILESEIEKLYYDLRVPYDVARMLPEDSDAYLCIQDAVTKTLNTVDFRVPYSAEFRKSIQDAEREIQTEFYEKHCGKAEETVFCVGHTHIDVAWMWTLSVTRDKAVRSFSTVLEYMKSYPDYIFMSSQPQLYEYVKELAPEVFEQIKERVKEGRWEPEGAMYLEADCNLTCGESLVRQILYGKKFFREEFGRDSRILWLPDVFGYSAALPQIMKKSGIEYFMTTKISWNETNKMPYDTFAWEGLDGTRILTHFAPTRDYNIPAKEGSTETEHFTTYNGMLTPSQVKGAWQRYSQKELNREVLTTYGYGDGGGGPTREMLENAKRLKAGIPGCPAVRTGTALEFFRKLGQDVSGKEELPVWAGELYLEYHRGTYTSMARNKKYNRFSEFLLMDTESTAALSEMLTGNACPGRQMDRLWKILLRNQFHDILPGSSIGEVYEESRQEYEGLIKEAGVLQNTAAQQILHAIKAKKGSLVVFHMNAFTGAALAETEYLEEKEYGEWEKQQAVQKTADERFLLALSALPSKGFAPAQPQQREAESFVKINTNLVETPYLRVALDSYGHLTSIFDRKEQRELLKPGECGNVLMTYEDHPHNFDAWDINQYYTQKKWPVGKAENIYVEENGPLRYAICIEYRYLSSTIRQHLYFYPDKARFDIRNEVDWKEKQILLKDWFPVDIHTNEASYEIQFGNVTRATHYNTSWDEARFEVCAQKWIDVSENGYGISVLNDSKFGYSVHDGRIGLTMLKSAVYPNPDADREKHEFTYAFLLHEGGWREAETVKEAYLLNNPPVIVRKENETGALPPVFEAVRTDCRNIVIETLKKAEEGDFYILRAYECHNRRSRVKLHFGMQIAEAFETDLLEKRITDCRLTDQYTVETEFRPFEIKTLKVRLGGL